MSSLRNYLESGNYLPKQMRDFHDQKDLFKSMHHLYQDNPHNTMPNWVDGHKYIIDWFLWFMASRGYTLQKTKKKGVEFAEWPNYREIMKAENYLGTRQLCALCDAETGRCEEDGLYVDGLGPLCEACHKIETLR